ncbi:MAG TPA: hypothetical protein VKQ36_04440, partial [Ktedonobacterales bacterium]|nr:hypothetical protein [Ktedonobacterales bacterium]
ASAELGLRERPAAPSTMAPSPRQRTISSDRGTLLPPTAVAGSQSYSPLADAATRERFDDGQPDAGFEQEPTMRLWPPAPPTPSADLDALEDENPTAPTIPIPATSPAQAAQPAAAMTWDEAARRGANEISEWGSWEEQPTANLPAASFGVTEAPPAPDETEASVTAASSEEPGEIGASHRTETIEAQETTGAPDGSAPQSEPGESQVGEALDGLPDEVEEGATTQPSLQRIARQAAIEEARRQLAAQAGAVERHGVVTPLARDAIIWPVVDALPIAPGASYPPAPTASSSATQTNKATNPPAVSNTGVRAAPDSPRQTGKLLAYEVSSPGTVEITVEHEGTSARATDVALTYEVSTQQKDEEHA